VELGQLWRRPQLLAAPEMPLYAPPRSTVSARRSSSAGYIGCDPSLSFAVEDLSWTDDNLLRQMIYQGLHEDKPAAEVRRSVPHQKPISE